MTKNRRFTSLFWAKLLKIWPYGGLGAHRKFGTTSPNSARWHHSLIGLQSTPWSLYFPPNRPNSGLESQKRARGHLSPEIGDRFPLTLMVYSNPSTSWPNSHKLAQLTCTRGHWGRGGDSDNWELHVNQPNSAGILYNYLCILYIISNPSSLYTFNAKFGWILRL